MNNAIHLMFQLYVLMVMLMGQLIITDLHAMIMMMDACVDASMTKTFLQTQCAVSAEAALKV